MNLREFIVAKGYKDNPRRLVEDLIQLVFLILGLVAVGSVLVITIYLVISGLPAIFKIGPVEFLFGTRWASTASEPQFGILPFILTSIYGTAGAIIIGVPIGFFAAVFLAKIAPKKVREIMELCIGVLAGIPSVVYGLLGILIVNPVMYHLELWIYANDPSHQFTGGANLLSAILVLAIMILPTLINISETALQSVPDDLRKSSLALGASKIQTIFKVVVPAAKNGIMSAIVLGVGRAIGEAMAILLVAGNSVSMPFPFNSVRFLTTAIVSEMGYANGTHRQVLFTIGLVLFVFIMIINLVLTFIIKKGDQDD